MPERLERSDVNRMWSGVCGGIAEYFAVDPTLVRAFFVIATIFTGGIFLLVYIALVIIMPVRVRTAPGASPIGTAPSATGGATEPGATPPATAGADATRPFAYAPAHDPAASARRREAAGWFVLALGVVFLLANAGVFRFVQWQYIWPVALIALGAYIVLQRSRP